MLQLSSFSDYILQFIHFSSKQNLSLIGVNEGIDSKKSFINNQQFQYKFEEYNWKKYSNKSNLDLLIQIVM
jgi:hypothetical protein